MKNKSKNHSQQKKEEETLSVLASGDTNQGGTKSQDDRKLQLERSASLLEVTHADTLRGSNHREENETAMYTALKSKSNKRDGSFSSLSTEDNEKEVCKCGLNKKYHNGWSFEECKKFVPKENIITRNSNGKPISLGLENAEKIYTGDIINGCEEWFWKYPDYRVKEFSKMTEQDDLTKTAIFRICHTNDAEEINDILIEEIEKGRQTQKKEDFEMFEEMILKLENAMPNIPDDEFLKWAEKNNYDNFITIPKVAWDNIKEELWENKLKWK